MEIAFDFISLFLVWNVEMTHQIMAVVMLRCCMIKRSKSMAVIPLYMYISFSNSCAISKDSASSQLWLQFFFPHSVGHKIIIHHMYVISRLSMICKAFRVRHNQSDGYVNGQPGRMLNFDDTTPKQSTKVHLPWVKLIKIHSFVQSWIDTRIFQKKIDQCLNSCVCLKCTFQ